jgi:hypothetical protein
MSAGLTARVQPRGAFCQPRAVTRKPTSDAKATSSFYKLRCAGLKSTTVIILRGCPEHRRFRRLCRGKFRHPMNAQQDPFHASITFQFFRLLQITESRARCWRQLPRTNTSLTATRRPSEKCDWLPDGVVAVSCNRKRGAPVALYESTLIQAQNRAFAPESFQKRPTLRVHCQVGSLFPHKNAASVPWDALIPA